MENSQEFEAILIYQMAKVGSSSIFESLETQFSNVYHIHRLYPPHIQKIIDFYNNKKTRVPTGVFTWKPLYDKYILEDRAVKIITPVREPVSRNMSAFFHNFKLNTGQIPEENDKSINELVSSFKKNYNHNVPLTWFDDEFEKALGFSIYDYPFKHDEGYVTIKKNNLDVLVFTIELSEIIKNRIIGDFLGVDDFEILHSNVGFSKAYGDLYKEFLKGVSYEDEYIDKMYDSKYAQHFYSLENLQELRLKWQR